MLSSWKDLFNELNLAETINKLDDDELCPRKEYIFRCFSYFEVLSTRVVICGQDPYHTRGTANGLAFAAINKIPPSLRNIFKEVKRTYPDSRCDIEEWAKQGVLMFNRAMSVKMNKPNSQSSIWRPITNRMIKMLNAYWKENNNRVIFLLWGNNAKELCEFIDDTFHIVLTHTHPSPLSRKPFVGNNHFVMCNEYLTSEKIKW